MPKLAFRFIGPPQIESDGAPVTLALRKGIALLAYLAVTELPQSRDALANLLWPGYDQSSARGNLRRTLYAVQSSIGGNILSVTRNEISLPSTHQAWFDVQAFKRALGRRDLTSLTNDSLMTALQLYRGDFLQGFSVDDSPEFDAWQRQEAEILRVEFAAGNETLIAKLCARQDYGEAITVARRCLTFLPDHESVHRALMELYALSGRQAEALRQYARCREMLHSELGVEPTPATQNLYERIRSGQLATQAESHGHMALSESPSIETLIAELTQPHDTIPILPTAFVPRDEELNAIKQRLHGPKCRLLVLLGPGGVGKTYLAAQVAHDLAADNALFSDGVHWVDFAGYSTPDAVAPAIADALGLRFRQDAPKVAQLVSYLAGRSLLLVLDNFEHLIDAADLVATIMAGAANCKLLVTSRIALQVRGEWLVSVGGMLYPGATGSFIQPKDGRLDEYGAVRLFHEAGHRHLNHFSLQDHAASIVRICQLVDGLPLALELAATWLKSMSCEEIAARLETDVGLLSTRERGVPLRHTSVQAIFDHSWNLLSPEQRRALVRLSVLHGRFDFAAAEAVAAVTRAELEGLIDHSFVRWSASEQTYTIHELLRQFAAKKLADDPAMIHAVHRAHADYYARFLEQRQASLAGVGQETVLNEINAVKDNIRAAWRWSVINQHLPALESMIGPLFDFYIIRSRFEEGVRAVQEALEGPIPANAGDCFVAQLFNYDALCHFYLGDQERSQQSAATALELAQSAGAPAEEAYALRVLGMNAYVVDNFDVADDYLARALQVSQRADDKVGAAVTLYEMGYKALLFGDPEAAREHFLQSLDISRRLQRSRWMAYALDLLAFINFNLGNFERAALYFEEALGLFQALGDRRGIGKTIGGAERARLYLGVETVQSVVLAGELALELFEAIGDKREEMGRLEILTHVMLHDAHDVVAARGYVDRALEISRHWPDSLDRARVLLVGGMTAIFENNYDRARRDILDGLTLFYAKANPLGIGFALGHLALLLAKGVDFNVDSGRSSMDCQADGVAWLTAIRLHSPAYFWIDLRDWGDPYLDALESEIPASLFAQAQTRGRTLSIEETVRGIIER
jgi:predicted ATPase/DNA-binding SARP family transcriptional activator